MKKLVVLIAAVSLALVLAGCSCTAGEPVNDNDDAAVEESADTGSESADVSSEDAVIIGESAWSDSDDAAAAAEASGFTDGFALPDPLPIGDYPWEEPTFTSMDNVAEAHYNGDVVGVTVRKGEGVPLEELSSDLSGYGYDWTQDCDGIEVFCHGYEEGVANFIEWESEGCSYDVWCMGTKGDFIGMNADEVAAMVAGVK